MEKKIIRAENAPAAIGPYSMAVACGSVVYTSGQIGIDPATGTLRDSIEAQTEQVLANLHAVLEAAGSGLERVVKATVFLKDMDDFGRVNEVYKKFFAQDFPSRSAVQVARLPKDALVEIEVIAGV